MLTENQKDRIRYMNFVNGADDEEMKAVSAQSDADVLAQFDAWAHGVIIDHKSTIEMLLKLQSLGVITFQVTYAA